jgi:hypothetical protein
MELPSHFDHEKLDVYQLELKFLAWVTQFLADLCGPSLAQSRELRDMLTKLLERFDPEQFRVRESPSDPVVPFEHDDEHEDD